MDVAPGALLCEDDVIEESLFEEVCEGTPGGYSIPHGVPGLHHLYPHMRQPLPQHPRDQTVAGVEDISLDNPSI